MGFNVVIALIVGGNFMFQWTLFQSEIMAFISYIGHDAVALYCCSGGPYQTHLETWEVAAFYNGWQTSTSKVDFSTCGSGKSLSSIFRWGY